MLHELFEGQKEYNKKIRAESGDQSPESWTQTYLLGLVSEIDEVLSALNWKKHRRENFGKINRTNMGFELADLTKYVLSLWEVWGFSESDMCEYVTTKSRILEIQRKQEFTPIPNDCPVLICDLDGTLADYRKTFIRWLRTTKGISVSNDQASSLLMDTDLYMDYPQYNGLKEDFESTGGYSFLDAYPDGVNTVSKLRSRGVFVIINTARPYRKFKRIWWDTWFWLTNWGISVDKLLFGTESRILLADAMTKQRPGFRVFMFEDDPSLILRSANSGIHVFARKQPYNQYIRHNNVRMLDSYNDVNWDRYIEKGNFHE